MRALAVVLLCLSLIAPVASADRAAGVSLIANEGLDAWSGDTGTWVNVGAARVSPENARRLATGPGGGVLVNGPDGRTTNLFSKLEHGDVKLHVEFMIARGSNSGVYLQGRYEVQILDSANRKRMTYADCGAIYQRYDWDTGKGWDGHPPRVNASRAPGEWQSFDIEFRAPRFDAAGNKIANAMVVRVALNGELVQENVELTGPTRSTHFDDEVARGPLLLQGNHSPIAFRNIILTPLD